MNISKINKKVNLMMDCINENYDSGTETEELDVNINEENYSNNIQPVCMDDLINDDIMNNDPILKYAIKADDYKEGIETINESSKESILVKYGKYNGNPYLYNNVNNFGKDLILLPNEQRLFHEFLPENKPQKMFCDIDGDGIKISGLKVLLLFHKILDKLFPILGMGKFDIKNTYITKSKGKKLSFHWIYYDKLVFKTYLHQKRFWRYIWKYIWDNHSELSFIQTAKNGKKYDRTIVDIQCYSRNRTLRTIYSVKESEPDRVLVPIKIYKNNNTKQLYIKELEERDINIENYLVMTTKRRYYKVSQIEEVKITKIYNYINNKKIDGNVCENTYYNTFLWEIPKKLYNGSLHLFNVLQEHEYGFSKICIEQITDIKFVDDSKNCYQWNNTSKLWECKTKDILLDIIAKLLTPIVRAFIDTANKKIKSCDDKENKMKFQKIKKYLKSILKSVCSVRNRSNIIKEIRVKLMDEDFKNNLNSGKYILPLKNGKLINLLTKQVRDRKKDDYFSFELDVEYNSEYTFNHSNVDKLINPIFQNKKDLINYFHRNLGMCLTESLDNRQLYIWHGEGRNGKSAILDLMKKVMGNYFISASKDVFLSNNKSHNGSATSHIFALRGKRLATMSENNEDQKLNINQIKNITGGDSLSCRELYGTQIEFNPVCKLILVTNNPPSFDSSDRAILDRLACFPFNSRFVNVDEENEIINNKNIFAADNDFINSFADNHMSEFFTWLVEGCYLYFNDKKNNTKPECVKIALNKIIENIDSLQQFMNDECETGVEYKIECKFFKTKYDMYCINNNISNESKIGTRKIKKCMKIKGFEQKRIEIQSHRKRYYIGLKLSEDD
jgi:P4 family phage/plasmid primase-like protien